MERVPLLTTGLSGLVGSKFAARFQDTYSFENLDISHTTHPVDITDRGAVQRMVAASPARCLVHFAAFTDVTKAWEQQNDRTGIAYRVNVIGTQNLLKACEETGKHFVHVSTAYVFDGTKEGLYTEEDSPHPIEWYGQTKWLAEQAVQSSEATHCILRIDQPFRSDTVSRPDTVRRIAAGLLSNSLHPQFTDHTFGPTFIDDFARVLDWVVSSSATGLFHASAGESWNDYEFAKLIQEVHELPGAVQKGSLQSYLKTLNRPYQQNTALDTTKLKQVLPFTLKSVREAVGLVQLEPTHE